MYEPKSHPPIPPNQFVSRVLRHAAAAFALMLLSIALGMAGYECFEQLSWRDAFLNAAMLLGGMGPVDAPRTDGGKAVRRLGIPDRGGPHLRTGNAPCAAQVQLE